jgi:hypothetical protein
MAGRGLGIRCYMLAQLACAVKRHGPVRACMHMQSGFITCLPGTRHAPLLRRVLVGTYIPARLAQPGQTSSLCSHPSPSASSPHPPPPHLSPPIPSPTLNSLIAPSPRCGHDMIPFLETGYFSFCRASPNEAWRLPLRTSGFNSARRASVPTRVHSVNDVLEP